MSTFSKAGIAINKHCFAGKCNGKKYSGKNAGTHNKIQHKG